VVVDASMLIIGDHEQGFWPGGRLGDRLPDLIKKLLAGDDIMRRVLVVRIIQEARLDKRVLREGSGGAVALEAVEAAEVVKMEPQVGEHEPGEGRNEDGVVVDPPVNADVVEDVEDVAHIPVEGIGDGAVVDVAVGCAGVEEGAIGPSV